MTEIILFSCVSVRVGNTGRKLYIEFLVMRGDIQAMHLADL